MPRYIHIKASKIVCINTAVHISVLVMNLEEVGISLFHYTSRFLLSSSGPNLLIVL